MSTREELKGIQVGNLFEKNICPRVKFIRLTSVPFIQVLLKTM